MFDRFRQKKRIKLREEALRHLRRKMIGVSACGPVYAVGGGLHSDREIAELFCKLFRPLAWEWKEKEPSLLVSFDASERGDLHLVAKMDDVVVREANVTLDEIIDRHNGYDGGMRDIKRFLKERVMNARRDAPVVAKE